MKKLPLFVAIIVIVVLCILLLQFFAPKTGSIEINLLNPDAPYNPKVNIYLIAGESDSPQSAIIQKVEGVNSPGTITLTDIAPGVYRISSRARNYDFEMIFPDCNECNFGEPPTVEVTAGKTTSITIQAEALLYS